MSRHDIRENDKKYPDTNSGKQIVEHEWISIISELNFLMQQNVMELNI